MFKNVASQKIQMYVYDYSTGDGKTGDSTNLVAYISKDFGSVTSLADTTATEIHSTNARGWYIWDLSQTETNADALLFTGTSTGSTRVAGQLIYTDPPLYTGLSVDASGRVDVIKVAGTTQTAGDIIGDTNDIQTRIPASLDSNGFMKSGLQAINTDTTAAGNLAKTTRVILRGIVQTSGTTTTAIATSSFDVPGIATDQFKGRIVTFDATTTTTALRGQSTDITGSSIATAPILTVTALTTIPQVGDTFSVT